MELKKTIFAFLLAAGSAQDVFAGERPTHAETINGVNEILTYKDSRGIAHKLVSRNALSTGERLFTVEPTERYISPARGEYSLEFSPTEILVPHVDFGNMIQLMPTGETVLFSQLDPKVKKRNETLRSEACKAFTGRSTESLKENVNYWVRDFDLARNRYLERLSWLDHFKQDHCGAAPSPK